MAKFLFTKTIWHFEKPRRSLSLHAFSAVLLLLLFSADAVNAQPAARRREQQQRKAQSAQGLTTRAQISYPVAAKMSEDVVWRRDIYREILLQEDANAALYYPVEPAGSQMNLFTYLFKLMMGNNVKGYEYRLDGNEVFTDSARIDRKGFLDNYHVYYERTNNSIHIDDSDIPSAEVKSYYIKESAYYDQASATFHVKPVALCPVLWRTDDFGDGEQKYPLFWVRYDEAAPYLARQVVMTSNLNNAATMSMDDYFTRNLYKGKIYKTNNMLGRTLAQYCPNDSALAKEQRRIENELAAFEKNIWGDQARKDSLDSIAKLDVKDKKAKKAKRNRRASTSVRKRSSSSKSSGSQPAARVTVRRQRH